MPCMSAVYWSCSLVERVIMCAWLLHVSVRLYSFIVRRVDYFLKLLYFNISSSTAFSWTGYIDTRYSIQLKAVDDTR